MRTKRNTSSGQWSAIGLLASCLLLSGCQQLGAAIAVMKGGESLAAEHTLGKGPLAIVMDDTEQLGVPADAMRVFHETLTQEFQDRQVNKQVVAFPEVQKLRRNEVQFDEMSIRQIGEKLGAEQVLYCKVTYWALRERPGDPHLKGLGTLGLKVVSTERKRDVKLWPADRDYVSVSAHTDPDLNESIGAESQIARRLAEKLAAAVGSYFHEHKARERLE